MRKAQEPRVAVESFRPYYEHIMRYARNRFIRPIHGYAKWNNAKHIMNGVFDKERFCEWCQLDQHKVDNLKKYMGPYTQVESVPLDWADKLMTAYGIPDQVCCLYLVTSSVGTGEGISYAKHERELCLRES